MEFYAKISLINERRYLPHKAAAELIMDGNTWLIFDGIAVVVLLVFMFITIKRGLIKGIVSSVGFLLAAAIAITTSGSMASSIYNTATRSANYNELKKQINEDTLVSMLAAELEKMEYNLTIDEGKLRNVLEKADDYDTAINKFVNNINGKKVADEEEFKPVLHKAYSNIIRDIISKHLSKFAAETAADKVLEKPSTFTKLIPLMLDGENLNSASDYICDTFVEEPYSYSFRLITMIALLAAIIIFALILAGAIGRNDTMQPGLGRHLFCAVLGLVKGAVVVFLIAVLIRTSVVYGTDKSIMNEYPAIDNSFIFKYVYNFVCGLR